MDEMIWDTKTMTSSDFSIKVYLNDNLMKKWSQLNDGTKSFKQYFQQQIENQIKKLPQSFSKKNNFTDENQIKVASVHFGYDNRDLINLLKKRGQAII